MKRVISMLAKLTGRMYVGYAVQNADDFLTSYDAIIEYVNDRDNWPEMEDELRSRGVRSDVQLIFVNNVKIIITTIFLKHHNIRAAGGGQVSGRSCETETF